MITEIDPPCLCASCTCSGCHEECYRHCHGCGSPVDACNSYQTGGEKQLAAREAAATALAFDYSGLDEQTISVLQGAEQTIRTARKEYIIKVADAVGIAHDELVRNSDGQNNQYTENTFISWCASVGLSKATAYQLLQVSNLLMNSAPNEQKILEQAQPSLLYAAARPSAPAELVEQVKSGGITTHKQYQALLAEINAREAKIQELIEQGEKLEQALDEVSAEKAIAKEKLASAQANIAEAEATAQAAQALLSAAQDAQRDAWQAVNEETAEKQAAIERAQAAERRVRELESRPIEVAVQPPGEQELAAIRRQAEEEARQKYYPLITQATDARKEVQARADELAAQLRALQREARMPDIDTVYPMCRDYARSIATFQSTFLMVGAGLGQREFTDCAHELMDAAQDLCCVLQATIDSRTTQKEEDLFD